MPAGITKHRRLPAEWEKQSAVALIWPHPSSDWLGSLEDIEKLYLHMGAAIARHQQLLCICQNHDQCLDIRHRLVAAGALEHLLIFSIAATNDTWGRDTLPLSVSVGNESVLVKFNFNGWGEKYPHELDDALVKSLRENGLFTMTRLESSSLILEGGALETDGMGTLIATRSSIQNPNRNPGLSIEEIEDELQRTLGLKRFLWLDHGYLSGDDTDSHIDTLVRFVNPDTLVYTTANADDKDHFELVEMERQLEKLVTADGKAYRLIPLPPAGMYFSSEGEKLPANYANFLITNSAVLVPFYGGPNDTHALDILRDCFPERQVVGIDCRAAIEQRGAIHCLTMQMHQGIEFSSHFQHQP